MLLAVTRPDLQLCSLHSGQADWRRVTISSIDFKCFTLFIRQRAVHYKFIDLATDSCSRWCIDRPCKWNYCFGTNSWELHPAKFLPNLQPPCSLWMTTPHVVWTLVKGSGQLSDRWLEVTIKTCKMNTYVISVQNLSSFVHVWPWSWGPVFSVYRRVMVCAFWSFVLWWFLICQLWFWIHHVCHRSHGLLSLYVLHAFSLVSYFYYDSGWFRLCLLEKN